MVLTLVISSSTIRSLCKLFLVYILNAELWCETEYPGPDFTRPLDWTILHEGYNAEDYVTSK